MVKILTKTDRKRIVKALRVNSNATQVAHEIGLVSQVTIWKIANTEGIKLTAGNAAKGGVGNRISPYLRARIVAALRANPNARQVARRIRKVSYVSVWMIAKAEGINLTRGSPRRTRHSRWVGDRNPAQI